MKKTALGVALLIPVIFVLVCHAEKGTDPGTIQTGDIITFGQYEQDSNPDNGAESIEWIVIDEKDGKALLISKYGLDVKPYHTVLEDVTWETCALRSWLNNEFLNSAFTETDREAIVLTEVDNGDEQGVSFWNAIGGNNTWDRIFLLSNREGNNQLRKLGDDCIRCELTQYAADQGSVEIGGTRYSFAKGWWLRSPGETQLDAECSSCDSWDRGCYGVIENKVAVRPVLWLDMEKYPEQMYYKDIQLDRTVYTGSWQETYASVLKENENLIRNHQAVYENWSSSDEGEDLRILFLDLNGDGIPEMLFFKAGMIWDAPFDEDNTDLLIYSNNGTQTACVISIQDAYTLGRNGPEYSLFTDAAHPGILYVEYYDGTGMWQVGYDTTDGFRQISNCRCLMEPQDEGISNFYFNGNPISKSDWTLYNISPVSDSVTLIASSCYPGAVYHGQDYDSAVEYLTGLGSGPAD